MTRPLNPLYNEITPFSSGEPYQKDDWRKIPEIVHSDTEIKGFFGEFRFLSNFGKATVNLDGLTYPSTERAYQAAKWEADDREVFLTLTNEEAIKYNRQNNPNKWTPEEWDANKLDVMRFLLEQKFDPELNPENYQKLMDTGDKYLEETNWWNDTFWGKNLQGEGANHLGRLLMEIRESYRQKLNNNH